MGELRTLKPEREYGSQDRLHKGTEIVAERWYYCDDFMTDDDSESSTAYLFTRRYRLLRTAKGNLRLRERRDVETFPNTAALLEAIEFRPMALLPVADQAEWAPPALSKIRVAEELLRG